MVSVGLNTHRSSSSSSHMAYMLHCEQRAVFPWEITPELLQIAPAVFSRDSLHITVNILSLSSN